jgi:hypothetical protein
MTALADAAARRDANAWFAVNQQGCAWGLSRRLAEYR